VCDFLIGRLGLSTAGANQFSKTNQRFSGFKVSVFSLPFFIVRERAPESYQPGRFVTCVGGGNGVR